MKKQFLLYRPFLQFLGIFFGLYLILTLCYQFYLNQNDANLKTADNFTILVAKQAAFVLQCFDKNSYAEANNTNSSIKLFYKSKSVSRVIEGCNALSLMILFISFVVAFPGKLKQTMVYIFFGILIIHVFNVLRIALLSVLFYEIPKYKNILHNVFFPFIIYSIVFVLWVVWVTKFSNYATKNSTK